MTVIVEISTGGTAAPAHATSTPTASRCASIRMHYSAAAAIPRRIARDWFADVTARIEKEKAK